MQTFLPLPEFHLSAHCLDNKRLGKQRVECLQLLHVNLPFRSPKFGELKKGWTNHPAAKMWRGHDSQLISYTIAVCNEWIRRGFKDSILHKVLDLDQELQTSDPLPKWIGDDRIHSSHRSNLLRKMPEWYTQYGWSEADDLPYYWPGEK